MKQLEQFSKFLTIILSIAISGIAILYWSISDQLFQLILYNFWVALLLLLGIAVMLMYGAREQKDLAILRTLGFFIGWIIVDTAIYFL